MQRLCCPKLVDDQFVFERCIKNGIGVIIVEKHYIFGVATRKIGKRPVWSLETLPVISIVCK